MVIMAITTTTRAMRYRHFVMVILFSVFQAIAVVIAGATTITEEGASSLSDNVPPENNSTTTTNTAPLYTCFDDASWAIVSQNLSSKLSPDKQRIYDEFMSGCEQRTKTEGTTNSCHDDEMNRLEMNIHQPSAMRNFTKHGFVKTRAPPGVMTLLQEYFDKHYKKHAIVEWHNPTPYHNNWISPPTIIRIDNTSLIGGGPQFASRIGHEVQEIIQNWTNQRQSVTSVYGIRIYHNQSILTPHVDRLPLVSSAIINVAQDVDVDWPLEVYDHNGMSHNVTMQPGDMILYESHSIIHGRPFPLKGRFYANVFIHFEPLGSLVLPDNKQQQQQQQQQRQEQEDVEGALSQQQQQQYEYEAQAFASGLPHYIIPGTAWAQKWWETNPRGWSLFTDIEALIKRGDLDTLRYIHQHGEPVLLQSPLAVHTGWQPIHEAVRDGHLDIVQFFIEIVGANVNADCYIPHIMTPLALSRFYHGIQHEISLFLERHGAIEPSICAQVREIHESKKLERERQLQEQ